MDNPSYSFETKVWLYPGETAAWHFVTLPFKEADSIKQLFGKTRKGWGSLRVRVKIGSSTWETSIFPDTKSKSYLLPLKAAVRKKEQLSAGSAVHVDLEILIDEL